MRRGLGKGLEELLAIYDTEETVNSVKNISEKPIIKNANNCGKPILAVKGH